jgi:hypothetical protein
MMRLSFNPLLICGARGAIASSFAAKVDFIVLRAEFEIKREISHSLWPKMAGTWESSHAAYLLAS